MPSLVEPSKSAAADQRLRALLQKTGKLAVAVSGGVDSVLLAAVAVDELGADRVLLLNARSPAFPEDEAAYVSEFAAGLGVHLEIIDTEELSVEDYVNNPPTRCYHCRTEMYGRLKPVAASLGFTVIADGANLDDRGDYRPGMKAAAENEVRHPLQEAGFGKSEIRELAQIMGLSVWDKPAFACLASRFPYGEHIDAEKLARVQHSEACMRDLGFVIFRVRSHGDVARVEVAQNELDSAFRLRGNIVEGLKGAGYDYVTLDLEGFRSGSMNETLLKGSGNA